MRLQVLNNGHSFLQKIQLFIIKTIFGQVPGPIAVLSYKRHFFGKYYAPWLQNSMRNMKHWTIGEVELMAAYVSKHNECQYCYNDHVAVAKAAVETTPIDAVMDNIETAPIEEKMKAALRFIEKLTVRPNELTKADIDLLKEEELSREAIEEIIHVCGAFNVINRLADAFNFELTRSPKKVGRFLFKNGYGTASLIG